MTGDDDEPLDPELRDAARAYHEPPEVPREALWTRIQLRRAAEPIAAAPARDDAAYRLAAAEHLGQAEAFLTLFRASVREGHRERLAPAAARQLLATNRLLLDSPAAADPRLRFLLQDLELVLAEIAQLAPERRHEDLKLITDGLDRDGMLVRLRAAVPAGTGAVLRKGVL